MVHLMHFFKDPFLLRKNKIYSFVLHENFFFCDANGVMGHIYFLLVHFSVTIKIVSLITI